MIIKQSCWLHREIKVWYSTSYILIENLNWYPQTSWTQFSSEFTSTISKISRLCLDFFDFSQFCHSVYHKITFWDKILSHLTEKVTETAVLWNVYGVLRRISSDFKMVLPYHIFVCGCIVALNMFKILCRYHCFVQFRQFIDCFFEVYHRNCHMSQMANMFFPTWNVHICQVTSHRGWLELVVFY